jgi:outer membrane protein insertion porin family
LNVHEQELFSGQAIKRSIRKLIRLDYFEDIKVNQIRGSDENKLSLKLDVVEKPTGTFSFGAGYSSEEQLFFIGSIAQRNLLGRGQTLRLSGQIGGTSTRFVLSFTEPWLFDTRLSATIEAYNQKREYEDTYDVASYGGGLRFSYPILRDTRLYWSYTYKLEDVNIIDEDETPDSIVELEGINRTSSAQIAIGYDSRDRVFNPTEGSKHSLSFEYAGLGGDIGFNKYEVESGWYLPIYKGLVGFVHGRSGYVHNNDKDKRLPDYETYYLGGINTLRGFDWRGVHLTEVNSEGKEVDVGGEIMVQFNVELIFPLYEKLSLMGLVFYDTGNVYDQGVDLGDLRKSAGYGIRWFSPIAPIRIEYGYILDPREGEDTGRWEFTMGGAF